MGRREFELAQRRNLSTRWTDDPRAAVKAHLPD
jgi:hypothetical protein